MKTEEEKRGTIGTNIKLLREAKKFVTNGVGEEIVDRQDIPCRL